MIPEIPADYYTFCCWYCEAKIQVEITTIVDMIATAKSKNWSIAKGKAICPKCKEEKDAKHT